MVHGMDKYRSLGKLLTLILRHEPHKFGIELSGDGYAPLSKLVVAIRNLPRFSWVTSKDILHVVKTDDKHRFELKTEKGEIFIRARYGHSKNLNIRIEYPLVKAGEIKYLYHGTQKERLNAIMREGLKPMDRKYVHLSATIRDALEVAKRRKGKHIVLVVDAERMIRDGIKIYRATQRTFLVDYVPPSYIVKALEL